MDKSSYLDLPEYNNVSVTNTKNDGIITDILLISIIILFIAFLWMRPCYDSPKTENYENLLTQKEVDRAMGRVYGNVKVLVDTTADEIVERTMRTVVSPCMLAENLKNINTRMQCIQKYKHYYSDILQTPLTKMFSDMDRVEVNPFQRGILKERDQRYEAMVGMVQAYVKALDNSLKVLSAKYSTFGYVPEDFRKDFLGTLRQWMMFRMVKIFRNPDFKWSATGDGLTDNGFDLKRGASLVSTRDSDTDSSGLPADSVNMTELSSGAYSVRCTDLWDGDIAINADGNRLRCPLSSQSDYIDEIDIINRDLP